MLHKHHRSSLYLCNVDILVVNEIESEKISGEKIQNLGKDGVVNVILDKGVNTVVMTLGENGCFYKNREENLHFGAFEVDAVDTTAAGDTFIGYFLAAYSQHADARQALKRACAASAISSVSA